MRKLIIATTALAFVASIGLVSSPVFAQDKATSGDTMSKDHMSKMHKGHMSKMSKKKMTKHSKKMDKNEDSMSK